MEPKKSKLILKGINESTGIPFIKEIHSLDEVKTSGTYIVIARNATSEKNGFPKIHSKADSCFCCEANLVVNCCYNDDESQSTNTYGQELTISDRKSNTIGTYKRTVGPAGCSEWLMVATGSIKLVAQNNDIVKAYNEVSANLDAALGRIDNAEATVIKSHNTVLESATVRFDRIEENEATINAGEIGSTPSAIVYYKPANKFVAADSAGAYWETWDGMETYMNFGAICKDKVYLCGRVAYIWNGYTLSDSATEQGKIIKSIINKGLQNLHDNIVSLDFGTFRYLGGLTCEFIVPIQRGDIVIFNTTTTTIGHPINIVGFIDSKVISIADVEGGENKTVEWIADESFNKIGVYFPTTAPNGECTFSVNIIKKRFVPNAGKILFNDTINFNFAEKKIEIPQARLIYAKYSLLINEQTIDLGSIDAWDHNYVLYYDSVDMAYKIHRTSYFENIHDYDKFVLASFNAAGKLIYGISTYKINGDIHNPISEEKISRISRRNSSVDVDITNTLENGYVYLVSGTVNQIATIEKSRANGWLSIACNVVAGDMFTIIGTGGESARLFAITDENGTLLSIAEKNASVENHHINIDKNGVLYINILQTAPYKIIKKQVLSIVIQAELDRAKAAEQGLFSNIKILQADIFDNVRNGIFSIDKSFNYNAGNTYELQCKVNTGFKYTINIDTDKSGFPISLLKILEDGTYSHIHHLQTEENKTLVFTHIPTEDAYGFAVYFASTASSGNATVKITAEFVQTHPRCFQFGKTCDCDYKTEHIPAFTLPAFGERCNYFHGLYDELVSAYPQYVSKVDCDTELADNGISKPDYLNGYNTYMYKFIPAYTPNTGTISNHKTDTERLKVFIISGTHPEYMGIWDLYHTMRIICEKWESDKNIEELRWNCEFYIIPCSAPWGIENSSRVNFNGIDLNRNMPTENWDVSGSYGDNIYSGEEAGSEYESKLLMYYMKQISPTVFIDHHNTNTGSGDDIGEGKNVMYITSKFLNRVDIASAHISQMTRRWKSRSQTEDSLFVGVFPSNKNDSETIFGFAQITDVRGTRGVYGDECGAISFTYESNSGILYKNGMLSHENRQVNTALVSTCATDGFINFLLRVLKTISEDRSL